jgi:NAD(P)-dependent dehydrogenase (short-subunit alcohol dehydrogenase family)
MNIVITGTSRGIGLELTKQAASKGHQILAVARNTEAVAGLKVKTLALDVRDAEAAAKIAAAVADWPHVDIVINNAGVYRQDRTAEDFLETYHVNCVAPYMISKALLPALKKAPSPKLVQITSKMGSIADNTSGGSYSYRSSKAALNMINKNFSIENEWLTAIVVHPGWVQTEMGGVGAPTPVTESAQGIWHLIHKAKSADSGEFFDYQGEAVPW